MRTLVLIFIFSTILPEGYSQQKFSSLPWIIKPEKGKIISNNEHVYLFSLSDAKVYSKDGKRVSIGKHESVDGYFYRDSTRKELIFFKKEKNLYGLVNRNGDWILNPNYKSISVDDNNEFISVTDNDGKVGVIDSKDMSTIIPIQYKTVSTTYQEGRLLRYNLGIVTHHGTQKEKKGEVKEKIYTIINGKGEKLRENIESIKDIVFQKKYIF